MLDFTGLRLQDDTPIYQQLIRHVQLCVVAGSAQPGDELPSRRLLSAQLGVNPNTVQKAYRQLEEEGLLRSFAGSKSVLIFTPQMADDIRSRLLAAAAKGYVSQAKQLGLSADEALAQITQHWKEETE